MHGFFGRSILEEGIELLVEKRSNGALEKIEKQRATIARLQPLAKIAEKFISTVKVGDVFRGDTGMLIRITEVRPESVDCVWRNKNGKWYESFPGETMENLVTYRKLDPDEVEALEKK